MFNLVFLLDIPHQRLQIFYMAGGSKAEVAASPFVERLLRKGFEVSKVILLHWQASLASVRTVLYQLSRCCT